MDYDLSETAYQRACKDTRFHFGTIRFWVFELLITAGLTFWVLLWTPTFAEEWHKVMYQILIPMIGSVVGLGGVFLFSLAVAPVKQRNEARSQLYISGDEISKIVSRLSALYMSIDEQQENYASLLMKCASDLATGSVRLSVDEGNGGVREILTGKVRYWTYAGMRRSQLRKFLAELRLKGIVEMRNRTTGSEDEGGHYYFDSFYITDFGRQVVRRIEQIGAIAQQ